MAMTAAVTEISDKFNRFRGHKVEFTWVCDDSGDATGTTTETLYGFIRAAITNPGPAAPTADYDVYLRESNAGELAGTDLENRHTTTTEATMLTTPMLIADKLTCVVANAGDTKSGVVTVLISGR